MKYIKEYEIIIEKLGVSEYLFNITDDIIKNLNKSNNYKLLTTINGHDITINCIYNNLTNNYLGIKQSAYVQIIDLDNLEFKLYTTELTKSTILHELKHIDRMIKRNLNADISYNLNHVGRMVTHKFKHLLHSKDSDNILIDIFYKINNDEFEAYYNTFYIELKEIIDINDDDKIIKDKVYNFLNKEDVYLLYKYLYENKFDICDFFDTKSDLNNFIEILALKIEQHQTDDKNYDIKNIDIIFNRLKIIFKQNKSNNSAIVNQINSLINRTATKGYKKFNRLYTIFIN